MELRIGIRLRTFVERLIYICHESRKVQLCIVNSCKSICTNKVIITSLHLQTLKRASPDQKALLPTNSWESVDKVQEFECSAKDIPYHGAIEAWFEWQQETFYPDCGRAFYQYVLPRDWWVLTLHYVYGWYYLLTLNLDCLTFIAVSFLPLAANFFLSIFTRARKANKDDLLCQQSLSTTMN